MNLELAEDRRRALTVACRWCSAATGQLCTRRSDGRPLERLAAHEMRLRDAGVIHAPIDSRDLRGR